MHHLWFTRITVFSPTCFGRYFGLNISVVLYTTQPTSTHYLYVGLKLTTWLHQTSLRTDQTILTPKILIFVHFNLHYFTEIILTKIVTSIIVEWWWHSYESKYLFYSPTDAQVNCLKNNFKIYIKTAPKCFGAVSHTIIRERIARAC
jgi:hypothetical protein